MKLLINFFLFSSIFHLVASGQNQYNYQLEADAELIVAESRIIANGYADFTITQAYSIFHDRNNELLPPQNNNLHKKYNGNVYCDSLPLGFSRIDSNYVMIDSSYYNRLNFNWQFTDITDTNTIIQFSTFKPIGRVSNFSSSINDIHKDDGFIYSHPQISADSIVYIIGSDSLSSVKKTLIGNSSGVNFSSLELAQLSNTTQGTMVILIYNMMPQIYNNRKYYFQNNSILIITPLNIN